MNGLRREAILVKKRFLEDFIKGSTRLFYHILMVGLSAALALSLPMAVGFIAKKFLVYWSLIGNDKIFLISVEMTLTIFFIFLSTHIHRSWKDRKLSKMAKAAGIVFVTPAKGFFAKRRIRKLKERQGIARDIMVISSTGFRTFVDPKGELHQVIQNCRQAKIMLLNPSSEGAIVRAKGIPDPDVTPESFGEQIRKSIDFLKLLKDAQRNVRLKLYPDPPFLKMTILGDYIWLQHYQPGLDGQRIPRYVFKHDPNIGSLYFPFYQYFLGRWNDPEIPEYDLETDELIYRDGTGSEVKREKLYEMKTYGTTNRDLTNHGILQNENKGENKTFSPLLTRSAALSPVFKDGVRKGGSGSTLSKPWPPGRGVEGLTHRDFIRAGGSWGAERQNLCSGLHPGSKEFFLLRSKSPLSESAGWIAI
jgi:hypothetical protein